MASSPRLYAIPYDTSVSGFTFRNEDQFLQQYEERAPVEEYEIDFLEGDDNAFTLYQLWRRRGFDVIEYFHSLEMLENDFTEDEQRLAMVLQEAEKFDPAGFRTADDFREQLQDFIDQGFRVETGNIRDVLMSAYEPGSIELDEMEEYFDWDAYARDVEINGGAIQVDRTTTLITPRFPLYG